MEKQGNCHDGDSMPAGMGGAYFYFRQSIGLLVATAGIVFTIVCYDKHYYGMGDLTVTWIGLILATVGMVFHEFRPYKAWDDWTLLRGWLNGPAEEEPAAGSPAVNQKESKKKQ
mmetsp:Transcript_21355/g.59288  ORF Transcript_21355/g.59288 Transcript_21355/m.59288 type:complete len:114 (-) Transcript_21355:149-490(-)|eukprot:CAMPEP_0117657110 /NCGR_PEP_ID=MMETSP0804-20121206/5158_1 /TAXON_ID=1074897 /ORGANISM="Tetraselmis astigmatica, Strain CCMP880" /LENGTH=113 /DNA_ID=CAMNT_0005463547 /DNA_START=124 /DNA_END=465 /DNA_ORIENTATION=-